MPAGVQTPWSVLRNKALGVGHAAIGCCNRTGGRVPMVDEGMPEMSFMESVTHLCRACGLCCNGVLFSRVRVYPDEMGNLGQCGLKFYEKAQGQHYFAFPCPRFRFGVCGIYQQRPMKCKEYRCTLLRRLQAKEIELPEAMAIVYNAIDRVVSLSITLDKLYAPDWNKVCLINVAYKVVKAQQTTMEVLKDTRTFLEYIDRYFEKQDGLKNLQKPSSNTIHLVIGKSRNVSQ